MNREHILPQLLLRLWPFPRGAGRIIDRLFSRLSFSESIAAVRTTDGFSMSVMPNDLIGRHIYLTGEFDRTIVEVILKFAKPDDTLLDIGANIGYVSACFLANVAGSSAVAVDPQPGVTELLRANLLQFGPRARVATAAISDRDGVGHLKIVEANRGHSSLSESGVPVEIWSVAKLIDTFQIGRADIIKIDVEGHEREVLSSLESHLARLSPRLIVFEDHTGKAAPDGELGAILKRNGFRVLGVHKRLASVEFIPINRPTDCVYNDYIAVV